MAGCRLSELPAPQTLLDDMKKSANHGTIRVVETLGGPGSCGWLIYSVRPVYPKEAKKAHIEGGVKFDVRITKTGEVSDIHLVSSNPALVAAAEKAIKQRRYEVCRLNGQPVEIKTTIEVWFTLRQ